MRLRQIAAITVSSLLLAFLYYWSVVELVGYSAAVPKPPWWASLIPVIGRGPAALAWLEVLNTSAVIVAALFAAITAIIVLRQGALLGVVIAATAVAAFSIGENFGVLAGAGIHEDHLAVLVTDAIKLGVLPAALVLALRHWSSNNRWSGRALNKVPEMSS